MIEIRNLVFKYQSSDENNEEIIEKIAIDNLNLEIK